MNTSYNATTIFVLETEPRTGLNIIRQCTLQDFLVENCEGDPGNAWYVAENTDGEFEIRQRYNNMRGYKVIDTYATEAEAEQAHMDGLYWNYCNRCEDRPAHADTREELETILRAEGVPFATEHRLEQVQRATENRRARREAKLVAKLKRIAGDHVGVLRAWYASGEMHPAPQIVIDAKNACGLTWKEVVKVAKAA